MDTCPKCAGPMRTLFNTVSCVYGCVPDPPLSFPRFWSRYAPPPRFLPQLGVNNERDRYDASECVIGFNTDGDTRVVVAKNVLWPAVVGRRFETTPAEWTAIFRSREFGTDEMMKNYGCLSMAVLVG